MGSSIPPLKNLGRKVNSPVCDPVSACGHFFIFSSIDEVNDKKPYDNHYKHYPE